MSYLLGEINHFRRHWFSCLFSCAIMHVAFEGAEHLYSYLASLSWHDVIRFLLGTKI